MVFASPKYVCVALHASLETRGGNQIFMKMAGENAQAAAAATASEAWRADVRRCILTHEPFAEDGGLTWLAVSQCATEHQVDMMPPSPDQVRVAAS